MASLCRSGSVAPSGRTVALLLGLALLAAVASSYQPPSPSWTRASHALFRRSSSSSHPSSAASATTAIELDGDFQQRLQGADYSPASSANHPTKELGPVKSKLTKIGMVTFILSMCLALPLTLAPIALLEKLHVIDRLKREQMSLKAGCFCSRWLMRLVPFANLNVVGYEEDEPEPSVWVCNHTSMLDVFVIMAADKKLRGKNRRAIKIVYWRGLEDNPVTKLLFRMCGMIAVDMADNGNGNANEYDRRSFKPLLKSIKQAFAEGFDVGILPEGQLNPTPERGLLEVFPGAFTLARMSRRPIRMMALHGVEKLWHADESIGMSPTARDLTVRAYPPMTKPFGSGEEFTTAFRTVVGHFGATGRDVQDLDGWLDGSNWSAMQRRIKEEEEEEAKAAEKAAEEADAKGS